MFTANRLSAELLKLYGLAAHAETAEFEQRALRQLGRLVGFDGGIWGAGTADERGRVVAIEQATLIDRPRQMVDDYAAIAHDDPTTGQFIVAPEETQNVIVAQRYASPALQDMRDYLENYDVGALLLRGMGELHGGRLTWITAYRERRASPFSSRDEARYVQLLPHWFKARALCERLNRLVPPGAGLAAPSVARGLLTARQLEVLTFLALGLTYGETALRLGIGAETVKEHASAVYARLGVKNKAAAVYQARSRGLL